ncbi:RDD family protein [Hyphomonas jannaschiana]|uniref:RDD family protein n=1 Tax=Hyphomonas jannaschiana TaxID=86 RepID=UPI0035C758F8
MTTSRPVFGKKTSGAAGHRAARPAQSQALSAKAEAFLQSEREKSGGQDSSGGGFPFPSNSNNVTGGKPVWGRRVIARIVDELLVWGLVFLVFHEDLGRQVSVYIEAPMGSPEENAASAALFGYALLWGCLESAYNIGMEASRLQATLGKMLVGAVVTDRDGGKPGLGGIIMRNTLGRFIVNVVPFCAGYVMGLFRKDRRCLHDIMSGTMVRKRVPAALSEGYGEVFA